VRMSDRCTDSEYWVTGEDVAGPEAYGAGKGADSAVSEEVTMGLDDKIKNAAQDIAGKAKEAIGDRKGDDSLKAEGQKDQAGASAKKVGEDVKDVFK
jgi:uncharacterized protein YjbJ (UPF0337 family)